MHENALVRPYRAYAIHALLTRPNITHRGKSGLAGNRSRPVDLNMSKLDPISPLYAPLSALPFFMPRLTGKIPEPYKVLPLIDMVDNISWKTNVEINKLKFEVASV